MRIKNSRSVNAQITSWINKAEEEAGKVAAGLAATAFNILLYASPQKSADFVSNWKYSQNVVDKGFEERGWVDPTDSKTWHLQGALKGILTAKAEQAGKEQGFRLGGKIYLSNSASHAGHAYAQKIENEEIKFRPGNTGAPVQAALSMLSMYDKISKVQAKRLMTKKV